MGFSRQEYWSGVPFPSPGDLHDPGIELGSPALWADSLQSEPPGKSLFDRRGNRSPSVLKQFIQIYAAGKLLHVTLTLLFQSIIVPHHI